MLKVRIKFAKTGCMKYVGHLDIMRFFQKAIRRSQLPIRYSEGFNPHQIMSFAAPLGVGLTSEGEYLDIDLKEEVPSREALCRLRETMVDGMEVLQFRYLPEDAANAMASVAAASYRLRYKHPQQFPFSLEQLLEAKCQFYDDAVTITIVKQTKKGQRELDLKPLIYDFSIGSDAEGIYFDLLLSTGSVDNIKPELVMQHFLATLDVVPDDHEFFIHRIDLLTRLNEDLCSLGEIGYDK